MRRYGATVSWVRFLAGLLGVLMLASCTSGSGEPGATEAQPTSTAPASTTPTTSATTSTSQATTTTEATTTTQPTTTTVAAVEVPTEMVGEWRASGIGGTQNLTMDLRIDERGQMRIVNPNGNIVVVTGKFEVDGGELTVSLTQDRWGCGSDARYEWRTEGDRMVFSEVEESCSFRADYFTASAWGRK